MASFFRSFVAISLMMGAPLAMADDNDEALELREETRCFTAKGIRDFMGRFDGLKATQLDTLVASFRPRFEIKDEGALPDRFYLKSEGQEKDFVLDDDGGVPGFSSAVKGSSDESELCIMDKARAGTPVDQAGVNFSLPMSIRHINVSGNYDMAELADGLKDGKSFYKKMVGGPMAILVPKMTHIVVSYDDDEVTPQIEAFNGDDRIDGLVTEPFDGGHVVTFKDLKRLGATHLKVSGGEHSISPAPSIKTMKKFGIGG